MIPQHKLAAQLPAAREALGAFLSMLLGGEAALQVQAPAETTRTAERGATQSHLFILSEAKGAGGFALALKPTWIPLLSQAMLGERLEVGSGGYEELLREVVAQGYAAVRTQLEQAGLALPEADFAVVSPGGALPAEGLAEKLWRIPFVLEAGTEALQGFILLPCGDEAAEAAQPAAEASGTGDAPAQITPAAFPELGTETLRGDGGEGGFDLLAEVELEITVELGRRRLPLADLLQLTSGSVVELEKLVDEPLEVYANGRLIAKGRAVVVGDQFGVRISSLTATGHQARPSL